MRSVLSVACCNAWYGSTSLQCIIQGQLQSHVSGHNLQAAPPFNSGANAAPVTMQALPVQCHHSAGTDVGCGCPETTTFSYQVFCYRRTP